MVKPSEYQLPRKDSLRRWRQRLVEALPLQVEGQERYRIHYYDSFDWRLFRAGMALKWEQRDGDSRYCLYPLGDTGATISIPLEQPPPRFANDLPAGRLRERLNTLLVPRTLLLLAHIETRSQCLRVSNREGKTLARLFLEQHSLIGPDESTRILDKRLRLVPLRGYQKAAGRINARLQKIFALEAAEGDLLLRALAALGRKPGDYSSGINVPLEPGMRADAALRRVLLVLLDAMEANEAGAIEDLDSEFLHDLRVAVRRTRSALGQMKSVFPPATLARYRKEFAWMGEITSPTRDLDVYLLKFEGYQKQLPEDLRDDLLPLRDFLQRHQHEEQARLSAELKGAHYRRLKRSWRRYLGSPLPRRPRSPDARKPIEEVARRRTWRMYRRVMREGQAINTASPPADLHELRKSCKKLRYLIEFFQALFPRDEIRKLTKELKALQNNLGDFQDLEVQTHTLRQFSVQMRDENAMTPRTELAMQALLEAFQSHMQKVRGEFEARFDHFSRKSNTRRYQHLYKPVPG
jgi:CHAD domain-containing protein